MFTPTGCGYACVLTVQDMCSQLSPDKVTIKPGSGSGGWLPGQAARNCGKYYSHYDAVNLFFYKDILDAKLDSL